MSVDPNDLPRLAAADIGWLELGSIYFDMLLPFFQESFAINKIVDPDTVRKFFWTKIWRDVFHASILHTRALIMMSYHVVGMLSSSWVGSDKKNGTVQNK